MSVPIKNPETKWYQLKNVIPSPVSLESSRSQATHTDKCHNKIAKQFPKLYRTKIVSLLFELFIVLI